MRQTLIAKSDCYLVPVEKMSGDRNYIFHQILHTLVAWFLDDLLFPFYICNFPQRMLFKKKTSKNLVLFCFRTSSLYNFELSLESLT